MDNSITLDKYKKLLDSRNFVRYSGKVTKVVGLTIERLRAPRRISGPYVMFFTE